MTTKAEVLAAVYSVIEETVKNRLPLSTALMVVEHVAHPESLDDEKIAVSCGVVKVDDGGEPEWHYKGYSCYRGSAVSASYARYATISARHGADFGSLAEFKRWVDTKISARNVES